MNVLKYRLPEYLQEHPFICLGVTFVVYLAVRVIYLVQYRLFFSPLAKFPGPKIAAATHYYEFYYNYWCRGKYIYEIEKMHAEYGSHFLTTNHDLHRKRRKPLEPYFSRSGILRLQPLLAETTEKLNNRLAAEKGTGKILRLDHLFFAMSGDVVGKLCWQDKEEYLDDLDFAPEWYNLVHSIIKSIYLFQGFPWLASALHRLPKFIVLWLLPQGKVFDDFDELTLKSVAIAKQAKIDDAKRSPHKRNYASLFHWIINSDMPQSELDDARLANEAQVIQSAGSTSTARTLTHIVYHVLANPPIRERLTQELRDVMAEWPEKVPTWIDLEAVPYLQACLKEGLRHSYSTMHPLPRVAPYSDIQYKEWTIPAGTAVGMSAYLMHTEPSVYPHPFTFAPERWLGDISPKMMRNFVPFARGSRNCLGQNLALAELSLAIAVLFRPGAPRLRLHETDHTDTDHVHDYVVPLPRLETKGVRATVE
ncbi:hypothetical protein MMC17_009537 [Xylographa soralifera]|nr:hypothetical protein [Xylographa soralifera]